MPKVISTEAAVTPYPIPKQESTNPTAKPTRIYTKKELFICSPVLDYFPCEN
jgi:hypothetical protein